MSLSMGERRTEMMARMGKMLEAIVEVGKEMDRSSRCFLRWWWKRGSVRWGIDEFVRSPDFRCKALFRGYAELVRPGEV